MIERVRAVSREVGNTVFVQWSDNRKAFCFDVKNTPSSWVAEKINELLNDVASIQQAKLNTTRQGLAVAETRVRELEEQARIGDILNEGLQKTNDEIEAKFQDKKREVDDWWTKQRDELQRKNAYLVDHVGRLQAILNDLAECAMNQARKLAKNAEKPA